MKKPAWVFIIITGAFLCVLGGIFAGRNWIGAYIPVQDAVNAQTQATTEGTVQYDGKIDLNTATVQQFQLLPGIGETIAQRIVDYRTQIGKFTSIEELREVSGIGEKKFEQIAPYVKVSE